ncbi:MAG: tetratricopeptide repeat protein [Phycisphaerales bacterium]|nr:tetratricopeptide repeat protein [Phycisphaerales bacterium]
MRSAIGFVAIGIFAPAFAQEAAVENQQAPPPMVRYVNSAALRVMYPAVEEGQSGRLWTSADSGRTWQSGEAVPCGSAVVFVAPHDGEISLWVGPDGETPDTTTRPTARFIIDTEAPTIQIHELRARFDERNQTELTGRATLIEEHISPRGVRLFHRDAGAVTWTDGGVVSIVNGVFRWPVAPGAPEIADIRLVATDLAGNSTISQRRAARLRADGEPNSTSRPAPSASTPDRKAPAAAPPLAQPLAEDAHPVALESDSAAAHLKNLAREFAATGRFDLAAARFAEASRMSGDDVDSLAAWGDALLKSGALEDAQKKFEFALQRDDGMLEALMGMGNVAEQRGEYPSAAAWFRKAVARHAKSPDAWLRLGDATNRAGDATEARRAWQQAADHAPLESTTREAAERRLRLMRNLGD